MGIVYIAVSDRMYYKDEYGEYYEFVKIGVTKETIESRMKTLNGTSTPYPLECLYALDVGDKAKEAERQIHKIFDKHRIRKGKYKREFFKIGRDEAREYLKILEVTGCRDVTPDEQDTVDDEDDKRIMREGVAKRKAFNFTKVGIMPGTKLHFLGHNEITCEVVDSRRIKFDNKVTSLSNAAAMVLKKQGKNNRKNPRAVAGTRYWAYEGETLDVIRSEKRNIIKNQQEKDIPNNKIASQKFSFGNQKKSRDKKQGTDVLDLKHTRVLKASIDEQNIRTPRWRHVLNHMMIAAVRKGYNPSQLSEIFSVNTVTGRKEDDGYAYLKEINLSVQPLSANQVGDSIKQAGKTLGFKIDIQYEWRNHPKASRPGDKGSIQIGL